MSGNKVDLPAAWQPLFVGLFIIIAVGLRFAHLDRRIYWHDEVLASLREAGFTAGEVIATFSDGAPFPAQRLQAYQSLTGDKSWQDSLTSMASHPHQSPGFFLLSRAWMFLDGATPGAMRALAAAISLMALPAIYWLALALFRQRLVALLAIVFLCVSPMFVLLAREARPYSLWTVITMASSAAFLDALRRRRKANWILYAITLAVGIYTHLYFAFVMLTHGVYLLLAFVPAMEIARPDRVTMRSYVMANLVGLISFLPWVLISFPYLSTMGRKIAWLEVPQTTGILIKNWATEYSGVFLDLEPLSFFVQLAFVGPVLLFEAYAFIFLWRKGPRNARLFVVILAVIPMLLLFAPDLILGGRRSATARYQVPVFISLQLAVTFLLGQILTQTHGSRRSVWLAATVALLIAGFVTSLWAVRAPAWWDKGGDYGYPETVSAVNQADQPLVIVGEFEADLFGVTMAIANEMEPHVHMLWTTTVEPHVLDDYGTVFLFRPSAALRQSIENNAKWQVKPVVTGKLWLASEPANQ